MTASDIDVTRGVVEVSLLDSRMSNADREIITFGIDLSAGLPVGQASRPAADRSVLAAADLTRICV